MTIQLNDSNLLTQKNNKYYWIFSISWLLIICLVSFIWHLGSTGLVDETEPLFAEASKQMVLTGDYITPYFNGETRFDKPPLIYWLMAIFYNLFGINEWAVRLPSALASCALIIMLFFTLKSYGYLPHFHHKNEEIKSQQLWLSSWIGSAICALNLQLILWSRQGVSDALLNACIGISLLAFFQGYNFNLNSQENKKTLLPNRWYLASYIFSALAVLTKGPIGIVFPSLIIIIFLAYVNKLNIIFTEMKVITGALIFAVITIPWFIAIIAIHGNNYTDTFFGYHNLERFTSVVNSHSAPWYFYFLVLLGGFFPWSIYLPYSLTLTKFWQPSFWRNRPRNSQLMLFAFIWFAVIFGFFSVAVTKLPSYILPLIPATSILVTLMWTEQINLEQINPEKKINRGFLVSNLVCISLVIILGIAFYFIPQLIGNDPASVNLPQAISDRNINLFGSILLTIAGVISAVIVSKKNHISFKLIIVGFVSCLLFLMLVFHPLMFQVDQQRQLPLRKIAMSLTEIKNPTESLTMIGFKKPSLVFYGNQYIQFFTVRSLIKYEEKYLSELTNYLAKNNPSETTLIIGRKEDLDRLGSKPTDFQIIQTQGIYQVKRIDKKVLIDNIKKERINYANLN